MPSGPKSDLVWDMKSSVTDGCNSGGTLWTGRPPGLHFSDLELSLWSAHKINKQYYRAIHTLARVCSLVHKPLVSGAFPVQQQPIGIRPPSLPPYIALSLSLSVFHLHTLAVKTKLLYPKKNSFSTTLENDRSCSRPAATVSSGATSESEIFLALLLWLSHDATSCHQGRSRSREVQDLLSGVWIRTHDNSYTHNSDSVPLSLYLQRLN